MYIGAKVVITQYAGKVMPKSKKNNNILFDGSAREDVMRYMQKNLITPLAESNDPKEQSAALLLLHVVANLTEKEITRENIGEAVKGAMRQFITTQAGVDEDNFQQTIADAFDGIKSSSIVQETIGNHNMDLMSAMAFREDVSPNAQFLLSVMHAVNKEIDRPKQMSSRMEKKMGMRADSPIEQADNVKQAQTANKADRHTRRMMKKGTLDGRPQYSKKGADSSRVKGQQTKTGPEGSAGWMPPTTGTEHFYPSSYSGSTYTSTSSTKKEKTSLLDKFKKQKKPFETYYMEMEKDINVLDGSKITKEEYVSVYLREGQEPQHMKREAVEKLGFKKKERHDVDASKGKKADKTPDNKKDNKKDKGRQ